jgi:glycerate dehydrogenase
MNLTVTFKVNNSLKDTILKHSTFCDEVFFLSALSDSERAKILAKTDILFTWNTPKEIKEHEFSYLKNCKLIQLLSAGANHLPFHLIDNNSLLASNVGAYAKPMAEHCVGMILALAKSIVNRHLELKNNIFNSSSENRMVEGSICGIVGFGGIGQEVANLVRAFGVKVYTINSSGKTDKEVSFIGTLKDLAYLLKESDIVVLSIPYNKYTHNLINKEKLSIMKPNAILINLARGDIIVEKDIYEHLKNNPDFLFGTDTWWVEPFSHGRFEIHYPFFDLPNFLGSPHNSAIVKNVMENAAIFALSNIKHFVENKPIKGIVKREEYL